MDSKDENQWKDFNLGIKSKLQVNKILKNGNEDNPYLNDVPIDGIKNVRSLFKGDIKDIYLLYLEDKVNSDLLMFVKNFPHLYEQIPEPKVDYLFLLQKNMNKEKLQKIKQQQQIENDVNNKEQSEKQQENQQKQYQQQSQQLQYKLQQKQHIIKTEENENDDQGEFDQNYEQNRSFDDFQIKKIEKEEFNQEYLRNMYKAKKTNIFEDIEKKFKNDIFKKNNEQGELTESVVRARANIRKLRKVVLQNVQLRDPFSEQRSKMIANDKYYSKFLQRYLGKLDFEKSQNQVENESKSQLTNYIKTGITKKADPIEGRKEKKEKKYLDQIGSIENYNKDFMVCSILNPKEAERNLKNNGYSERTQNLKNRSTLKKESILLTKSNFLKPMQKKNYNSYQNQLDNKNFVKEKSQINKRESISKFIGFQDIEKKQSVLLNSLESQETQKITSAQKLGSTMMGQSKFMQKYEKNKDLAKIQIKQNQEQKEIELKKKENHIKKEQKKFKTRNDLKAKLKSQGYYLVTRNHNWNKNLDSSDDSEDIYQLQKYRNQKNSDDNDSVISGRSGMNDSIMSSNEIYLSYLYQQSQELYKKVSSEENDMGLIKNLKFIMRLEQNKQQINHENEKKLSKF
ncbi:hypothetical protein PPERSA_05461 [Pseudocohnilembus persalinus]|uniref:Uncharacterized protein n=1 Tax=Pseudocohnilembus persalinus TaxID=266149 RepID=A0A0V0R824_PSEPJ|nr:hypothetical protein PPERSA_05461 [Pseudocohnilembus persalinus]|eukprot:KRX10641.1 hypothetical protein PPERSA_05461 [Pseudocohnilembus persalinus]